jgi:hypothetical protein
LRFRSSVASIVLDANRTANHALRRTGAAVAESLIMRSHTGKR